jgi:anti-sigma regulatory factor (Ser/Thr protein kinase)
MNSEFTIEFTTSPSWFRTIRQLIFTSSTQCGFDTRTAGQIAMAVDEALCNIHRHGYRGTFGSATLHAKATSKKDPRIIIKIYDEAKQVDVLQIKSRNLDEVRPGGLGVHLIQTVMDEAIWTKRDAGGMCLSMSKTSKTNTEHPLTTESNMHD